MQYCIYLRKSRADEELESRDKIETLARHERALLDVAKRQHLNITQIYREVVSGETIAARPEMRRLLDEVERGVWEGVLVMEVERLARGDTIDQGTIAQAFKLSGTKIITPIKTYDPSDEFDEEYFEFGLFMSRREYKMINRRMQRGRQAARQEGKFVGNRPPYGYEKIKLPSEKGYTLKPVPEEAAIVQLIYQLYTQGENDGNQTRQLGTTLIARRLNDSGLLVHRDKPWTQLAVRDILLNPVYAGQMRIDANPQAKKSVDGRVVTTRVRTPREEWVIVPGRHDAIIDELTYQTARTILRTNRAAPVPDRGTIKNPLAGLVVCARCGRRMVRKPLNYKNRAEYLFCPNAYCDNASAPVQLVERNLLDALREWLEQYKVLWDAPQEARSSPTPDPKETLHAHLERELKRLNQQITSTYDLLEQGVYDKETFLQRNTALTERIQHTTQELDRLQAEMQQAAKRELAKTDIIPHIQHLLDVYWDLPTPGEKNRMLKNVIEKVSYDKQQGGRWKVAPDDFRLILYPRLPD